MGKKRTIEGGDMKKTVSTLLDVSEEARHEGIIYLVMVDPTLIQTLKPNQFLSSLGISLEDRIGQLLQLAHAYIMVNEESGAFSQPQYYLPFMVLKGPLVREDSCPVLARVHTGEAGKQLITLSHVSDEVDSIN
jgi:hypothetical protein